MTSDCWNPNQYEKFKAERSKPFHDLMKMLTPRPDLRVLDLGCGTGELTATLHNHLRAKETLGIDSSQAMLEKAQAYSALSLKFQLANIETFQPQTKFDVIFSNAALQWLPKHNELFQKILSWISSGGQIAVQMPCNFDHVAHALAYEVSRDLFKDRITGLGQTREVLAPEEYASLLFRQGFQDIRVQVTVYPMPLKSGADVFEWTRGTLLTSFQSQLSESDFTRFAETYRTRLIEKIGLGPYLYTFKRLFIVGTK